MSPASKYVLSVKCATNYIMVVDCAGGDVVVCVVKHDGSFSTLVKQHGSWHDAHVQACELADLTGLPRIDLSRGPQ